MSEDFKIAGSRLTDLLEELIEEEDLNEGEVMTGVLSAMIFRLVLASPDISTAIGVITSSMAQGAHMAALYEEDDDESLH